MKPKFLIACLLTVGLPVGAAAGLRAQNSGAAATQAAQSADSSATDPQFAPVTDKPHAGTPQADAAAPQTAQPGSPAPGTSEWYKESPQRYDHGTAKPRHLRAPKGKLQVYDDAEPPTSQMAQEEPPQQDAQQYGSEPLPQRHIQAAPNYYSQPQQQAYGSQNQAPAQEYAQPRQNYPQQQYGQQQGYPQQQYGQQQGYPQQNDDQQQYAQPGGQQQYAAPDYPQDDNGAPDNGAQAPQPTQAPLSAQQLEQLVAPIAIYPDQLLAQILTASTYPAQITAANQMVRQMNGAAPEQIAQAANAQTAWDPSVKALTAFPQVLQTLDSNLQWTSALGNAYYNQPQDVMQTVQALRERAQQSGNLQSTPQEQVVQQPNYIQIQPTSPDYVYVPSYNPWYAYGAPIAPYPSFEFGNSGLYIGGGIDYGLRFAMQPFYGYGFGWGGWGLDWMGSAVMFHNGCYWSHSREMRDWGFRYGASRWAGGGRGWYGRGYGGRDYARFGNYHNQPIRAFPGGSERGPIGRAFGGPREPNGARPMQGFGRNQGGGPVRPEAPRQQAFNGMPNAYGRPQQFQGRTEPMGGQAFANRPQPYRAPQQFAQSPRPGQGFAGRPQPLQNYHPPQMSSPRGGFGGGYPGGGRSFAQPQQRSRGGFFGGGHSQPSFGGGRAFNGGGGHSFGGGGGHSFGGGHSSGGGGHSSGGHHR
jgi:hypothetical protein